MKNFIIAIDGNCGSGKTTLSLKLQERLGCHVYHMDDFYLPLAERKPDWEQIPAGNMDFVRFEKEVLQPIRTGHAVRYRKYFCRESRYLDVVWMMPEQMQLVEGSYSQHPMLAPYYDLKIFLTCTKQEQKVRLQMREGERYPFYEKRWIPLEERYFAQFQVQKAADLVFHTQEYAIYDTIADTVCEWYRKVADGFGTDRRQG